MVGRPKITRSAEQLREIESHAVDIQIIAQQLHALATGAYRSSSKEITIVNRLNRDLNRLLLLLGNELEGLESVNERVAEESLDQ